MVSESRTLKIAIVGGGLVGSLAACYFAERGHLVHLYEYRSDIRVENSRGQSIDLALSIRGREALRKVGLENDLLEHHGIPMRGRMIHGKDGSLKEIIYDSVMKNCIYSVGRKFLNELLLNATDKYPRIKLNFDEKLVDADLIEGKMKFINTKTKMMKEVEADLIVGADGAYSKVRKIMMKMPLFDFSQSYIEHGYVELLIPPGNNNEFTMSNNNLHVWPRGEFMMIALPNDDKSFTGNLFAPFDILKALETPEDLLTFYEKHFPDVLSLIDREKLIEDFFINRPKTLVSIKCKPYHVGKTIIVGDAAHAMVPFYAQGMNAGFEDILILDELMERYNSNLSKVLPAFSEHRCEDAHAICSLAMYNYVEMRDLVRTRSFILRKHLDNVLYRFFPNNWVPLYSTVHFSRMGFRKCIDNKEWQDRTIRRSFWYASIGFLVILIALIKGQLSSSALYSSNRIIPTDSATRLFT